jgi:phosphoribosyl-ATP pyrophosphohydrolase/phosphoribosyl-AMP cyclohydrolase
MTTNLIDQIQYDAQGLVPAIVQDDLSGEVLTLAYMNRESLRLTLEKGETFFWSRRRQEIWHKGETSGNVQKVKSIWHDCDSDALLVRVEQTGGACHTGEYSCFFNHGMGSDMQSSGLGETIGKLARVIRKRNQERPAGSYTVKLLEGGTDRILKKVGEEAGEVIIAAKNHRKEEISWEVADLLYHTLVLLEAEGVPPSEIAAELEKRAGKKERPGQISKSKNSESNQRDISS